MSTSSTKNLTGSLSPPRSASPLIDFSATNPDDVILDATKGVGVDCGVGYQAHDPAGDEHPEMVLDNLVKVVRATGNIGVVGVYVSEDPGAATPDAEEGRVGFNYDAAFEKGIAIGAGQCPVKRYNRQLRDLIIAGRANLSFIVSHELPLDQAADAYQKFDARQDGWTKVLLHPAA